MIARVLQIITIEHLLEDNVVRAVDVVPRDFPPARGVELHGLERPACDSPRARPSCGQQAQL